MPINNLPRYIMTPDEAARSMQTARRDVREEAREDELDRMLAREADRVARAEREADTLNINAEEA